MPGARSRPNGSAGEAEEALQPVDHDATPLWVDRAVGRVVGEQIELAGGDRVVGTLSGALPARAA